MPPLSGPKGSYSPQSGHERRLHPRLEHTVPVKISGGDVDIVTETRDISASGASCRVSAYLAPMTKLKIHLLLPLPAACLPAGRGKAGVRPPGANAKTITKRVDCEGVVVRAEAVPEGGYFHTAIFFSDIKPRDIEVLARFVASKLPAAHAH